MSKKTFEQVERAADRADKVVVSVMIILGILVVLAIFGGLTKKDNDESEILYCKMVQEGVWPDYNETYKLKCIKKVEKAK